MNDTGSDVMSILRSDLLYLGDMTNYTGVGQFLLVMDAGGRVDYVPQISVEFQLVTRNNIPWGPWIEEQAVVRADIPGITRLSGSGIRDHFYFGTPPGNDLVAVSLNKGGMTSLLPRVDRAFPI